MSWGGVTTSAIPTGNLCKDHSQVLYGSVTSYFSTIPTLNSHVTHVNGGHFVCGVRHSDLQVRLRVSRLYSCHGDHLHKESYPLSIYNLGPLITTMTNLVSCLVRYGSSCLKGIFLLYAFILTRTHTHTQKASQP